MTDPSMYRVPLPKPERPQQITLAVIRRMAEFEEEMCRRAQDEMLRFAFHLNECRKDRDG